MVYMDGWIGQNSLNCTLGTVHFTAWKLLIKILKIQHYGYYVIRTQYKWLDVCKSGLYTLKIDQY